MQFTIYSFYVLALDKRAVSRSTSDSHAAPVDASNLEPNCAVDAQIMSEICVDNAGDTK